MRCYVYLLRSLKDSKFYLGWTTDIRRRLDEHNAGLIRSTKGRRPFELIHFETYLGPVLAKARERVLKRSPRMLHYFKKRARLCSSIPPPRGGGTKEVVG